MPDEVEYEQIISGVAVTSEKFTKKVFVGDSSNGVEIHWLELRHNSDELLSIIAYDQDEKEVYTLNVFKPAAVEVFMKTIAVDGPETNEKP